MASKLSMNNDAIKPSITRWSPDTCDCVIETVAHFDRVLVPGMVVKDVEFLMMNEVCDDHEPYEINGFQGQSRPISL